MACYDVAIMDSSCHVIKRMLNPHFVSCVASNDATSIIHESLRRGVRRSAGGADGGRAGQVVPMLTLG